MVEMGWIAASVLSALQYSMTNKSAFIEHWTRMRFAVAVFFAIILATAMINPRWLWLEWTVFLPIGIVMLWSWRCWACDEPLLKNG